MAEPPVSDVYQFTVEEVHEAVKLTIVPLQIAVGLAEGLLGAFGVVFTVTWLVATRLLSVVPLLHAA